MIAKSMEIPPLHLLQRRVLLFIDISTTSNAPQTQTDLRSILPFFFWTYWDFELRTRFVSFPGLCCWRGNSTCKIKLQRKSFKVRINVEHEKITSSLRGLKDSSVIKSSKWHTGNCHIVCLYRKPYCCAYSGR